MTPEEPTSGTLPRPRVADLSTDVELLSVVLGAHERLDLHDQLGVLLEAVVTWTGATAGFALASVEERRGFAPVTSTVGGDDPRPTTLARLDAARLTRWIGGGLEVWEGYGPFAEATTAWSGEPPSTSLALPVAGLSGPLVAALWLLLDAPPDEATRSRLERLGAHVRPAVHNALQARTMRELTIKDDTAHCFNRRHFEACLPEELARAARFRTAMSLIFLDMDNLKEVNKNHGHVMGSQTLREVSQRVRGKIRRFDKLFRFGGDEFCIVLPETEWHGALEVAERVRDAIARQPLLVEALGDPAGVRMTASLGIASFPLHARTEQDLVVQADRAMQRIKNSTKNSIGIAEIVGDEDAT